MQLITDDYFLILSSYNLQSVRQITRQLANFLESLSYFAVIKVSYVQRVPMKWLATFMESTNG